MNREKTSPREGTVVFAAVFLLAALFLLSQIGAETKFSPRGKLFAQPRFWSGVGVVGMVLFGAAHLAMVWRHRSANTLAELMVWLRAVEFLGWFMAYVYLVPVVGYLAATVCFTLLLALREGYRDIKQLLIAVAVGVGVVLVFKTGLSVKIPGGQVYELLPTALRNFMFLNF